ncbi:MerR family transcriptional regulator [Metabacillus iocasae]|uniref:DNA-binding transcriptional MerR regulator n=1 Tax=Priestia iocasae TaxID=2291674 RepID=A0ABS2QVN5_9BACI|nr:MerR family transcriptional regulator [Metabacillus iocasae]MBM7703460.1 DNA-binding transcriptional MerR regulator [Metabacillus iocasae]
MKRYFKIGEMAKMFSISQATLRYYDEINLFKPNYKNHDNQYRYYSIEQFVVLDTIRFLRRIGFSVKDIQAHMSDRTTYHTRQLFKMKLTTLQQEIKELQRAERKLQQKISVIEEGEHYYHANEVVFKQFDKRPITIIYREKEFDLSFLDLYIRELGRTLPAEHPGFFTGDIGMLVAKEHLLANNIQYSGVFSLLEDETAPTVFLPEGTYACLAHIGPYESLPETYEKLFKVIDQAGKKIVGDGFEISMIDETAVGNAEHYVTSVQILVE